MEMVTAMIKEVDTTQRGVTTTKNNLGSIGMIATVEIQMMNLCLEGNVALQFPYLFISLSLNR